ncbi:hypothetical protein LXL04_016242 [Taraxacum kok-saghyz]
MASDTTSSNKGKGLVSQKVVHSVEVVAQTRRSSGEFGDQRNEEDGVGGSFSSECWRRRQRNKGGCWKSSHLARNRQRVVFEPESVSFENSYIPENPRTLKPLTFSKKRLRGAKNRSNTSPVAKKISEKNDFFFQKLCICAKNIFCICAHFFVLFQKRSNT